MKKTKLEYKQVKDYKPQLADLGKEGWQLVATEGNEGIFMLELSPDYEYTTNQASTHRRDGENLQETLDEMAGDGWRLISVLQGPRATDAILLFEREAGG